MIDVAVQRNDIAYELATLFIKELVNLTKGGERILQEVIYSPGNHDYSIWRSLQWERDVINNVNLGHRVQETKHVLPCVIWAKDLDQKSKSSLTIYRYKDFLATANEQSDNSEYRAIYSQNHKELDRPAHNLSNHLEKLFAGVSLHIVYSNLYLVNTRTNPAKVTLMTHGQYFEDKWCKSTLEMENWYRFTAMLIDKFGLSSRNDSNLNLMEQLRDLGIQNQNMNFAQFIQSNAFVGSDQSGTLCESGIFADTVELCFHRSASQKKGASIQELPDAHNYAKIAKCLSGVPTDIAKPIPHYLQLSLNELVKIFEHAQISLPPTQFSTLIFGHTHFPGVVNSSITDSEHQCLSGHDLDDLSHKDLKKYMSGQVFNTGGWLKSEGISCGALIPILDSTGEVCDIVIEPTRHQETW
ncbi:MAG: hypothetical protein C0621_03645 [Desulfuromonas sp.]|nr:MAG: hypothetical protein C0621_03645 [Desulfuromonas sp.]